MQRTPSSSGTAGLACRCYQSCAKWGSPLRIVVAQQVEHGVQHLLVDYVHADACKQISLADADWRASSRAVTSKLASAVAELETVTAFRLCMCACMPTCACLPACVPYCLPACLLITSREYTDSKRTFEVHDADHAGLRVARQVACVQAGIQRVAHVALALLKVPRTTHQRCSVSLSSRRQIATRYVLSCAQCLCCRT